MNFLRRCCKKSLKGLRISKKNKKHVIYEWSSKDSGLSFEQVFWKENLFIHRKDWFIAVPLILKWAPFHFEVDDGESNIIKPVMWGSFALPQNVLIVVVLCPVR